MFKQATKSVFGWLRSLRERISLKKRRGQDRALENQTLKGQRKGFQKGEEAETRPQAASASQTRAPQNHLESMLKHKLLDPHLRRF